METEVHLMDEEKKNSKSRSLSKRKKSSRNKSKFTGKHVSSSSAKRRRKKSRVINQRSVEDVHCFPIPFLDFFCGCNNNCGKEKNRIKKISTRSLSRINRKNRGSSKNSISNYKASNAKKGNSNESAGKIKITSEEPLIDPNEEALPKGLTEPIPIESLKINGSMRQMLANVRLTSIFGCPNVPKTMSQIKILLDNNPNLKCQLKQILGDNLKTEAMKAINELLTDKNSEECVSNASIDTSIHYLGLSKSVLEVNKASPLNSVPSMETLKKFPDKVINDKDEGIRKDSEMDKSMSYKRRSKVHNCYSGSNKSHRRNYDSSDSQGVMSKVMAMVFGPLKKNNHKKYSSDESGKLRTSKNKMFSKTGPLGKNKMIEMRQKYDEWCKKVPEDVKERFRWDDYVRVTMYLKNNQENSSNVDRRSQTLLYQWLKTFREEINNPKHKIDPDATENVNPTTKECKTVSINENNINKIDQKLIIQQGNPKIRSSLSTVKSSDMLHIPNDGSDDVIGRLNNLMQELLSFCEDGKPEELPSKEGETVNPQNMPQPGCSKWNSNELDSKDVESRSNEDEGLDQMKLMCISFMDKLSKHHDGELERNDNQSLRETPWQNKNFQVFCLPTIEIDPPATSESVSSHCECENEKYALSKSENARITEISNQNELVKVDSKCTDITVEEDCSKHSENNIHDFMEAKLIVPSSKQTFDKKSNGFTIEDVNSIRNQKRGSVDDNLKVDCNTCSNIDGIKEEKFIEDQTSFMNTQYSSPTNYLSCEQSDSIEFHIRTSSFNNGRSSAMPVKPINSFTEIKQDIQTELADNHPTNDKLVCEESDKRVKYIENHKNDLIELLKYLVSLADLKVDVLKNFEGSFDNNEGLKATKKCAAVQCKLSDEDQCKNMISNLRMRALMNVSKNGPMFLKSDSETRAKFASDCDSTETHRLNSSSSDSGVFSKSSVGHRRFTSLPDVLNGAPVVVAADSLVENSSIQESDVGRRDSSGSNTISYLSTSVSCQASQTPDNEDFSQTSSSDFSESNYKILECHSTTSAPLLECRQDCSSEKSRSSENTQSLNSNNTHVVKSKIRRILQRFKN